jgi:hypothetical protein
MIEWQVQRVGRELLRRQTKTQTSDAGLPLPDICITALRERQIRQQEQRAVAGRGWEAVENLVFTRDCGSPVDVTMEIYAQASSPATPEALRRLGEQLSGPTADEGTDEKSA